MKIQKSKVIVNLCTYFVVCISLVLFNPLYAADGKTVYQTTCKVCHATGIMGAPKFGDKKSWTLRTTTKGLATLEEHAIKGFKGEKGSMPPKGGKSSLTDDEVKAAVAYMVNSAK